MAKKRVFCRKRHKTIILTIRDVPEAGQGSGVIGAHGENLAQFLVALFDANERLPYDLKLTDEQLKQCILQEFNAPGVSRVIDGLMQGTATVAELRARYNHGEFTRKGGKGVRPEEMGLMRATRKKAPK